MSRRLLRRWMLVAMMGALLTSLALGAPRVGAQTTATTTSSSLTLVHQTAFVGPTGTFRAEVSTRGLAAGSRLTLSVFPQIPSRSRLERTIAGEQLGTALFSAPAVATGPATTVVSLPVSAVWPAPSEGTVLSNAGVYPVTIDATGPDGTRIERLVTHLIRLPAAAAPTDALRVGTVVTIDATPEVDDSGAARLSDSDAGLARDRLAVIDDRTVAPPLTLLATPFVLESLRAQGTTIRSNTVDRQTLSAPWVSIDTGALAVGQQDQMILDEGRVGDAALTSLFGVAPDRRTAVIDGSSSPRALDLAAAAGARSIVLNSSQIRSSLVNGESSVLTQRFAIRSANGSTFDAIASDDMAAVPFAYGRDPVLAAHRSMAELAMLHFEQPGAGRGVALSLPAVTAPEALRELLEGLTQRAGAPSGSVGAPVLEPVTLDTLFASTTAATTGGRTTDRDWTFDDPRPPGAWIGPYEQAQWDLRGLRTLLPDAADITAPVERSVLTAPARWLSTEDRTAALGHAQGEIRTLAGAVTLPSTQRVTLTSSSGDIPLTLTNTLPADAVVRVTVSSPKLDFPGGSTLDLVLPPGTTRATIQVTTRASGAFPMEVTVTSPDGVLPVASSRIDVRSTAISGWGLVLSIGAGLFLLVWWIRHFRHTRRARSLIDLEPDAT